MNNEFTSRDYYFFLLFLFLFMLVVTSGGGADHQDYLLWSDYFTTLNFNTFSEYPKSKNGLPLPIRAYGIGLLSAVPSKILFIKGITTMKVVSILLTIMNFALLYKISTYYKISKFSFLFLIAIAYLLLPAGYYFNKYSSETWTVFLTLLSIFLIERDIKNLNKINNSILIAFGIILYFLILVKVTNIFLALALLSIYYVKKFNKVSISKKNYNKHLKILAFGLFFIFFSLILVAIYYKLLNGNFFGSPYSYGDNEFSSFNVRNFKLAEVLFSTWHGLLFYHPFYLISILFLLIIYFKNFLLKDNLKWILLITLGVFLIQLLIQSSYIYFWMGVGTYGARGFAGISILSLYAILNLKNNFDHRRYNFFLKLITLIFLGYQTYLLSFGESNFYTLSNFLSHFLTKNSLIVFFSITLILVSIFVLKKIFNYNFSKVLKITVISMAFFAASQFLLFQKKPYLLFSITILLAYFFAYFVQDYKNKINQILKKFTEKSVPIILFVLFLFSIYFQTILFTQYKENMNPNFVSGNNFNCRSAIGAYKESLFLPNYQHEKKNWLNFLKTKGCL